MHSLQLDKVDRVICDPHPSRHRLSIMQRPYMYHAVGFVT